MMFLEESTRALTPMGEFIALIRAYVQNILYWITNSSYGVIKLISSEPIFLYIFGFIALGLVINTLSRLLQRD